jgi:hypothetical protein
VVFDGPTSDPFAIRLSSYHCFSCTSTPSVVLHFVEFTFARGFESYLRSHSWVESPRSACNLLGRRETFSFRISSVIESRNGSPWFHVIPK